MKGYSRTFHAPDIWSGACASTDDDVQLPRPDERPHAFVILFGVLVFRVSGDGSIAIVVLPTPQVVYLRTGSPHPTVGWPRGRRRAA